MPFRFLTLMAAAAACLAAQDARAIVERSIAAMDTNLALMDQYTYTALEVEYDRDRSGAAHVKQTELFEVLTVGGERHRRLIERNGKPLPANEASKEQRKLDEAVAKAAKLTPEERARKADKRRKARAKERERLKYIPLAFDFTLLGEAESGGRKAWVIEASPRASYKGKYDNLLPKLKGKLWIDQRDYQWSRLEAESLDTIRFGLFLARLAPGTKIGFELVRINDEIWLPKRVRVEATARVALLKKMRTDVDVTYGNYRKFQAESRIVGVEEIPGGR